MPHLDAAALVGVRVPAAHHVEHEGSGMVLESLLATLCSALHAVPVHLLLGVDAAHDVLVGQHELRDGLTVEPDVSVDEHEVVVVAL